MKQNWLAEVKAAGELEAVNLSEVSEGDQLVVVTKNTRYQLVFVDSEDRRVTMTSSSETAPEGEMVLMGCALGAGSSLSPDQLFSGGHLELNFRNEENELFTHTTSAIQAIALLQT